MTLPVSKRLPDDPDEALDMLVENMAQVSAGHFMEPTYSSRAGLVEYGATWRDQAWVAVMARVDCRVAELLRGKS